MSLQRHTSLVGLFLLNSRNVSWRHFKDVLQHMAWFATHFEQMLYFCDNYFIQSRWISALSCVTHYATYSTGGSEHWLSPTERQPDGQMKIKLWLPLMGVSHSCKNVGLKMLHLSGTFPISVPNSPPVTLHCPVSKKPPHKKYLKKKELLKPCKNTWKNSGCNCLFASSDSISAVLYFAVLTGWSGSCAQWATLAVGESTLAQGQAPTAETHTWGGTQDRSHILYTSTNRSHTNTISSQTNTSSSHTIT